MMSPALRTLPPIARLGFNDGWLMLPPSFLNFGLPGLLIDYRLVASNDLDLEPFATHDPRGPWRDSKLHLRCAGGYRTLWQQDPERLLAASFEASRTGTFTGHHRLVLVVGNSYAVQLSWSALWTCRIGTVALTSLDGGSHCFREPTERSLPEP